MKQFIILFFISLTLYATDLDTPDDQNITIWVAIFSLAIIGVIGLFFTSEQLRKFKEESDRREDINKRQDNMLSSMSEHIQNIAKETVHTAEQISTNKQSDIRKVINYETKLLSITTNLIEFLRIKSKKVEIINKNFNLDNLLNDITGTLKTNVKNIELDLIYDVDNNIPQYLIGDTLSLSKSIINILLFCVENKASYIILKITKDNKFSKDNNLYFSIKSDINLDIENNDNLFNSNYNEKTNHYESLGLFISKELAMLMDGDIITKNNSNCVEFLIYTPFNKNPNDTELSIDSVTSKNIYLATSSTHHKEVLNNILTNLNHKVNIISQIEIPDFTKYDLVIIDEELLTFRIVESLKKSDTKIITLTNIFRPIQSYPNSVISDLELNKPLTKQEVDYAINKLFKNSNSNNQISNKKLTIHRDTFKNSKNVTLNKFAEFRGTKILLVEDNLINQKVFIGILSKSGTKITVANDGQEALSILKNNENSFDIIFMDINMPIMDGYTASEYMRENDNLDQLPIVALTALTSSSEINKMFNCGMNGYLAKPLKKENLFTVFATFITDRKEDRRKEKREEKKNIITLDGLDITKGISYANGNEIFYREILLEFNDAYKDSDKIFKKLVNDFRHEQLRMLCVDINGLSASIGADKMHNLTTEILQRILYKKYDLLPNYIDNFTKEINTISNSIDKYIA